MSTYTNKFYFNSWTKDEIEILQEGVNANFNMRKITDHVQEIVAIGSNNNDNLNYCVGSIVDDEGVSRFFSFKGVVTDNENTDHLKKNVKTAKIFIVNSIEDALNKLNEIEKRQLLKNYPNLNVSNRTEIE